MRRVLTAAYELIVRDGYPAASIAAAAEVSPQTIYNAVGNKAAVLKACYDVTLAGDDDPVPMSERPQFRAMTDAETVRDWGIAYAHWSRTIAERVGSLLAAVLVPGAADAGVAEFVATIEAERRTGTTHAMTSFADRFGLPAGLVPERAVDIVWTLNSPEVYARLVHRRGWTPGEYEAWLSRQLEASLSQE